MATIYSKYSGMEYIIGVDIGTSGAKAVALSPSGMPLHAATTSYSPVLQMDSEKHELDPGVLMKAFIEVTASVAKAMEGSQLLAISFSSAMHGLMCVDQEGKALTNLLTWADQRSIPQARALMAEGKASMIHQKGGAPVHPMLPLCKILWIKENDPQLFASTAKFIGFKEYLFHQLLGEYVIDHSLAAATGLFNLQQLDWDDEILDYAGITRTRLSRVCSIKSIFKNPFSQVAGLLGINKSTVFIIGSSDGCLANIGSHCFNDTATCVTIGTSGAVRRIVSRKDYRFNPGNFAYTLFEDSLVIGGPTNNGGILLKWYGQRFCNRPMIEPHDFAWFIEEAMKAREGAESLLFLPYLYGERAPVWDPAAGGAFIGVHNGHGQTHFMRAVLESTCFIINELIDNLDIARITGKGINEVNNVTPSEQGNTLPGAKIIANGGFTRSKQWVQLLANITGRNISVRDNSDASSIGAAMLGYLSLGLVKSLENLKQEEGLASHFRPVEKHRELYSNLSRVYSGLYSQLAGSFHELYSLQHSLKK